MCTGLPVPSKEFLWDFNCYHINPQVSLRGPGALMAVSPAVRERDGSVSEHFLFPNKDAYKGPM